MYISKYTEIHLIYLLLFLNLSKFIWFYLNSVATPSNLNSRSGEWGGSSSSFLCYPLGICSCQAFNWYSLILSHQDIQEDKPPGRTDTSKDFRLSINTVYCQILLLFSFHTSTDSGIKCHVCTFVSLLWEYYAELPSGQVLNCSEVLFWITLNTSN